MLTYHTLVGGELQKSAEMVCGFFFLSPLQLFDYYLARWLLSWWGWCCVQSICLLDGCLGGGVLVDLLATG